MTWPTGPLRGRCQCGAVRYVVTAEPLTLYACHCTNCRRQGGSAFALSLLIAREGWTVTQGAPQAYRFAGDSGRPKTGLFCPECGVRLSHETDGAATRTIRAGTLDEISALSPVGHIWTRSALAWMRFGPDDLIYERGPDDDFAALIARWRAEGAREPD